MKKIITSLFSLILFSTQVNAQMYNLQVSQVPYDTLIGATMYSMISPWQDPSEELDPIEFSTPFRMGKNSYSFITIDGGYVILGDTGESFNDFFVVDAAFLNLCDRGYGTPTSISPIRYSLTGQPRERILTIEWRNHGFYGEWYHMNVTEDYGNFKIILDEAMQQVKIHYGEHMVKRAALSLEGYPGYSVYLGEGEGGANTFFGTTLAGRPSAPTIHEIEADTFLSGIPSDSTLYTFKVAEPLAGMEERSTLSFGVYPQPAGNYFRIRSHELALLNNAQLNIYGMDGRLCHSQHYGKEQLVEISGLPSGLYVVELRNHSAQGRHLLIKE